MGDECRHLLMKVVKLAEHQVGDAESRAWIGPAVSVSGTPDVVGGADAMTQPDLAGRATEPVMADREGCGPAPTAGSARSER